MAQAALNLLSGSFFLAVRAAAPGMIALLLATLVLGLIGRTLPQLNILVLGFGINSMVILSTLAISIGRGRDLGLGLFRTRTENAARCRWRALIVDSLRQTRETQANPTTPFDIEARLRFRAWPPVFSAPWPLAPDP